MRGAAPRVAARGVSQIRTTHPACGTATGLEFGWLGALPESILRVPADLLRDLGERRPSGRFSPLNFAPGRADTYALVRPHSDSRARENPTGLVARYPNRKATLGSRRIVRLSAI
jgi:hypothetical protein